jgi:hypothetical protein
MNITVYFEVRYIGAAQYGVFYERYDGENTSSELIAQGSHTEAKRLAAKFRRIYKAGQKDERANIAARLKK